MFSVSNFIVEVTRRCNMLCPHCLRGNAQRLDMGDEVIAAMFNDVRYINSICFTGGEPSLAVPVIRKVVDALRKRCVDINSFFIVTNGRTSPATAKKLALTLLDLYSHCDDDENMCGLVVSGDPFHDPDVTVPHIYRGLKFFREERHGPPTEESVIRTGRAELNGIGFREPRPLGPFEVEVCNNDVRVESVYVAANGNVVSDCDASYRDIDAEARGNVLREPLIDIVSRDITARDCAC